MSEDQNTEQRLTSLERFAEAVTIRQTGEDQLAEGVGRLSNETNSLHSILSKVDEQQRRLAVLDRRTELVEETAVSRDELVAASVHQEEEAFLFRKKTLNRIYLTGMLITVTLGLGVIVFNEVQSRNSQARYQVCADRNARDSILHDILFGLTKEDPNETLKPDDVKLLREGIRRLKEQTVDCEELLE